MRGPMSAIKTKGAIRRLGFECLSHTTYSPGLAQSDSWLFGEMKTPPK